MKYYAHMTDVETEASRNFDFYVVNGYLFLSSHSTVFHIIHTLLLIHISLKLHKLSLCLVFAPVGVSSSFDQRRRDSQIEMIKHLTGNA